MCRRTPAIRPGVAFDQVTRAGKARARSHRCFTQKASGILRSLGFVWLCSTRVGCLWHDICCRSGSFGRSSLGWSAFVARVRLVAVTRVCLPFSLGFVWSQFDSHGLLPHRAEIVACRPRGAARGLSARDLLAILSIFRRLMGEMGGLRPVPRHPTTNRIFVQAPLRHRRSRHAGWALLGRACLEGLHRGLERLYLAQRLVRVGQRQASRLLDQASKAPGRSWHDGSTCVGGRVSHGEPVDRRRSTHARRSAPCFSVRSSGVSAQIGDGWRAQGIGGLRYLECPWIGPP